MWCCNKALARQPEYTCGVVIKHLQDNLNIQCCLVIKHLQDNLYIQVVLQVKLYLQHHTVYSGCLASALLTTPHLIYHVLSCNKALLQHHTVYSGCLASKALLTTPHIYSGCLADNLNIRVVL